MDAAWTWVGIPVLVLVGIYLIIRTRAVQIRHIPDMLRSITQKSQKDDDGNSRSLSAFQTFMVAESARMGTGNIAGVAGAISIGGPGAIFWMWVMGVFNAAAGFIESTLAQVYKTRRGDTFKGGPAYYIQYGLGSRRVGVAFALVFVVCFALAFTSLHANTIVDSVQAAVTSATGEEAERQWLSWSVALGITGLTAVVIFGGVRRVATVATGLVPIMAGAYIVMGLLVIGLNITELPQVLQLIVGEAFNLQAAVGGGFGAVVLAGVQRGMFSNEAGMGSVPNVAATADVSHPAKQGLVQTLGVYVDTLILSSITAMIILLTFTGPAAYADDANVGAELTQMALEETFGLTGVMILAVVVFLLAFTGVLGNYSYGEANVLFIADSESARKFFAMGITTVVFIGSLAAVELVWAIAAATMLIIAVFNLVVISLLSGKALQVLAHYDQQKRRGLSPVLVDTDLPGVKNMQSWRRQDVAEFLAEREREHIGTLRPKGTIET